MLKQKSAATCKPENANLQKQASIACVEVYDNVSIVTTFNDAPKPSAQPTTNSSRFKGRSGRKRYDEQITGAEHNLWAYLKELKDHVDWTVGGPQRRRAGLLWVGSIRRLIDLKKGQETDTDVMRACMRGVVFAATDAEIAEFADYACRTAPREPDPYLIGQDLVYLDREWHANREPRRIWPYGRSRAWVETFFAAKERKNERDRGRRRRKAAGATPCSESLAACARAIGKSPKTLRHRFKKAGLSWAEVRNMATEAGLALPDFVRSLIKEDSIRSRTKKGSPTTERPRRKPGGRASKTATPLTTKKAVRLGADGAGRQEPISNIGRCSTCS